MEVYPRSRKDGKQIPRNSRRAGVVIKLLNWRFRRIFRKDLSVRNLIFSAQDPKLKRMSFRRLPRFIGVTAFLFALRGVAAAQTPAVFETPKSSAAAAAAPATPEIVAASSAAAESADRRDFDALRVTFLALARKSYLDKKGLTPLPALDVPARAAAAFPAEVAELKSLAGQAAFIEAGRGPETLPVYADMAVLVAERLGIHPPESVLPVYRDRVRLSSAPLSGAQAAGAAQLAAEVRQRSYKPRYLYLADVVAAPVPPAKPATRLVTLIRHGKKIRKRRVIPSVAPAEPQGPAESVLDSVDWDRAEELASAAEEGAQGWYSAPTKKKARREQRRRRGRCYAWVRMALQSTGLWTNEYRDEVPLRGDWRRARRAFSFAWAMNALESKEQKDPAEARKAPLQRLDLRVDPLVIGSIIVFDRNVCGFNNRSGHIEVVSSIEPLRGASYKFHELKLPCLIGAANAGRAHVYVPRLMEPAPSAETSAPRSQTPG